MKFEEIKTRMIENLPATLSHNYGPNMEALINLIAETLATEVESLERQVEDLQYRVLDLEQADD